MRLDFNVLWVEDNQRNVHSQRDRIETLMRKEGFKLRVQFAASVDEAKSFLSNDIYGDHIDLILMDYDLGPGKKGDQGLAEVREMFPYKDIVFYSGVSPAELMKMAALKDVQGIFSSHRNDLPDIVHGVFENLVHKVLDIDHSRGIVMGATSEIDHLVNYLMESIFNGCDTSQQKSSIDAVKKRVAEKRDSLEKSMSEIAAINHVNELEKHHALYTSDDRLRLLRKMMKLRTLYQEHDTKLDEYREKIMQRRNDLAHIRVERDGFSRKIFDRNGVELTSEDMRSLRVGLLEFQELFDGFLTGMEQQEAGK